jgi:putative ABC transport system substrate-binding protein
VTAFDGRAAISKAEGRRVFNHLVGARKERLLDREADRLRGLEVDRQLEFRGLLDGQVCGLRALQNLVHEDGTGKPTAPTITYFGRPLCCTRSNGWQRCAGNAAAGLLRCALTFGLSSLSCSRSLPSLDTCNTRQTRHFDHWAPPGRRRWLASAWRRLGLAWLRLRYPLTDPCPFDILQRGPGWRDQMQFNQLKRREFITLLGGAAAAWPLAARAQQPIGRAGKMPHVGVLMPGPAAHSASLIDPFYRGLRELGYTEGQNLAIERRDGDWKPDRLPALAAELVGLKVDIIVAWSTPTAHAAKQATNSIPIIAVAMADPVGDGLVASLARPGGNVTGTTFVGPELVARRLQLLRDVVPGLARVAALWHPHAYGEHTMSSVVKDIEDAARILGMQLQLVPANDPDDIATAFSAMVNEHAGAFIVMPSPMLFGEHRRIVEFAANNRLPGMYQAREFVDAGGLMSYGANLDDLFRRTATYVDKILKGAKPADLPVERPTKFELVINVKAARAVGLTINRDILLVADEVIE